MYFEQYVLKATAVLDLEGVSAGFSPLSGNSRP